MDCYCRIPFPYSQGSFYANPSSTPQCSEAEGKLNTSGCRGSAHSAGSSVSTEHRKACKQEEERKQNTVVTGAVDFTQPLTWGRWRQESTVDIVRDLSPQREPDRPCEEPHGENMDPYFRGKWHACEQLLEGGAQKSLSPQVRMQLN